MPNPYREQDQKYDHLDGAGIFDAATIREMAGYETDGDNADLTPEAIAARSGNIALTGAEVAMEVREEWVKSMDLPHTSYDGDVVRATPDQRAANTAAIARQKELIEPMRSSKV